MALGGPHLFVSGPAGSVVWLSVVRSFRCQWGPVGSWGVDGVDRAAVVRRLVALEETGRLGVEQVELAAGGLGVSSRTVWRWVRQARAGEGLTVSSAR